MRVHGRAVPLLMTALVALGLGVATRADDDHHGRRGKWRDRCDTIEIEEISFFFEFNATDEDLGVQLNLGAEPWNAMKIVDPCGNTILEVEGEDTLEDFGLSDLFFESNEPSFDDMSREEILALFPEGKYRFIGRTIEGEKLVGTATLTHDIPDAPLICSPEENEVVDPEDVVVTWSPVTTPTGIEIVAYQVIVTNEDDPFFRYDVRVPADTTSLSVPAAFFAEDTLYELEVLAVEESGNQTISLLFFSTE